MYQHCSATARTTTSLASITAKTCTSCRASGFPTHLASHYAVRDGHALTLDHFAVGTRCSYSRYAGDKNLVVVPGDHNTVRPAFFNHSAIIFLKTTMQIPDEVRAGRGQENGWGCACTQVARASFQLELQRGGCVFSVLSVATCLCGECHGVFRGGCWCSTRYTATPTLGRRCCRCGADWGARAHPRH